MLFLFRGGNRLEHVYKYILLIAALCVLNSCQLPRSPAAWSLRLPLFELKVLTPRFVVRLLSRGLAAERKPILCWARKWVTMTMREALRLSLEQYDLYTSTEASASFRLETFLIEMKQPTSGYTMVVSSVVRYKLIRNSDNRAMYTTPLPPPTAQH